MCLRVVRLCCALLCRPFVRCGARSCSVTWPQSLAEKSAAPDDEGQVRRGDTHASVVPIAEDAQPAANPSVGSGLRRGRVTSGPRAAGVDKFDWSNSNRDTEAKTRHTTRQAGQEGTCCLVDHTAVLSSPVLLLVVVLYSSHQVKTLSRSKFGADRSSAATPDTSASAP